MSIKDVVLLAMMLLSLSTEAAVANESRLIRLPSEYEATDERALGLNNMGTAGIDSYAAIRINPALLILNRSYNFGAAYHWPIADARQYYQLGLVDGTTSKLVAGASYTGFADNYKTGNLYLATDSPIVKRASLGVAYPLRSLAIGLSAHYIEANQDTGLTTTVVEKGLTLGFGVLGYITNRLRFGLSVENVNNENVKTYAPRVFRGGLNWLALGDQAEVFLDWRQRQRVSAVEGELPTIALTQGMEQSHGFQDQESMGFVGGRLKFYDVLQLSLSYGHAIDESERRSLASGLSIVNQGFAFTYSVARPYLESTDIHSSLGLTLVLKI